MWRLNKDIFEKKKRKREKDLIRKLVRRSHGKNVGVICRQAIPAKPSSSRFPGFGFHFNRFASWVPLETRFNRHFFTIFVEMQVVSSSRRLSNLLKSSSIFLQFDRFLLSNFPVNEDPRVFYQWRTVSGNYTIFFLNLQRYLLHVLKSMRRNLLESCRNLCFRRDFLVIWTSLDRQWEEGSF